MLPHSRERAPQLTPNIPRPCRDGLRGRRRPRPRRTRRSLCARASFGGRRGPCDPCPAATAKPCRRAVYRRSWRWRFWAFLRVSVRAQERNESWGGSWGRAFELCHERCAPKRSGRIRTTRLHSQRSSIFLVDRELSTASRRVFLKTLPRKNAPDVETTLASSFAPV